MARISETAARRVKIGPTLTLLGRNRVYVQLLHVLPLAKWVLKQSVKAHGPLVPHNSSMFPYYLIVGVGVG